MLYYQTINTALRQSLQKLMKTSLLDGFRLVGGTALGLQLGHRKSIDIDLFTAAKYGCINFEQIEDYLEEVFDHVDGMGNGVPTGLGKSYVVEDCQKEPIKLDLFYTDRFIQDFAEEDGIRFASIEEIIAMKIDVIQRGGRKKDFWDLHELKTRYSLEQMLRLHGARYPYGHEREQIVKNFTQFESADTDFDPICLLGKHWEFIKADFENWISEQQ